MKLFVDDIRACPKGWSLVKTITDAISILSTGMVDEISLDHDIQKTLQHTLVGWETYMPIAHYIALMKDKPKIRIHTANMYAGGRMAEIMEIAYTPYIYNEKDYEGDNNGQ